MMEINAAVMVAGSVRTGRVEVDQSADLPTIIAGVVAMVAGSATPDSVVIIAGRAGAGAEATRLARQYATYLDTPDDWVPDGWASHADGT